MVSPGLVFVKALRTPGKNHTSICLTSPYEAQLGLGQCPVHFPFPKTARKHWCLGCGRHSANVSELKNKLYWKTLSELPTVIKDWNWDCHSSQT
jgi:hypothetical protein